jgi:hypothetical protein
MATKKINKEETIMNIISECKKHNSTTTINMDEFNKRINGPNAMIFIKEAAELVGAEIIYL